MELIHGQPRDAEALLLLSGVLRKTRRWKSALRRLREIELLDTGSRWAFEIAQEKKWIEREMSGPSQPDDSQESLALEARDTAILESGQEEQIPPSSGPQESGQLISQ